MLAQGIMLGQTSSTLSNQQDLLVIKLAAEGSVLYTPIYLLEIGLQGALIIIQLDHFQDLATTITLLGNMCEEERILKIIFM